MLLYKQIEYSNHIMTGNSLGYISQYFGCCRKNFFFKNFEFLHNTTPSLQTEFYNIPLQVLQKLHWAFAPNRVNLKSSYYYSMMLLISNEAHVFLQLWSKKNVSIIFSYFVMYSFYKAPLMLCQLMNINLIFNLSITRQQENAITFIVFSHFILNNLEYLLKFFLHYQVITIFQRPSLIWAFKV